MITAPTNLPEFRQQVLQALEASDFSIGTIQVDANVAKEAVEEIVAGVVREYMREGELSACEKIVGQLLLTMFQK